MVKPRIGIITALAKECWAMKALLESVTEVSFPGRGAGRRYYLGQIPALDGGKHAVALCQSGVGNNNAAIRGTLITQHFPSIDLIIMVGIAGGVPNPAKADEHIRLGDIVVSSEGGVTQYDRGKEIAKTIDGKTTVELEETNQPRPPDPILLEAVQRLKVKEYDGDRPWLEHIERVCQKFNVSRPPLETDLLYSTEDPTKVIDHPDDPLRVPEQPRLFTGKIASGNVVLKNPARRDYLRDRFGVRAVEMETSGIADASWHERVGYLTVRSICDYCDSHKNIAWQKYAAIAAAGYARALIESLPTSDQFRDGGAPNASVDDYLAAVKALSEAGTYLTLPGDSFFEYVPLLLRRKDPKTDEQKTPLLLSAVLDEEPYVMFVGVGGAGKSTLLRRIARDASESPASLGLQRRYLPMVIRLTAFETTGEIVVEKRLRNALYKAGELYLPGDLPEGFFADWSKEVGSPWFLLFDGLDEVAADERPSLITQLANMLDTIKGNGHRAALTTRPSEFAISLESKLTPYVVLGFTSQQQKEFARNCFGADAEIFLTQIEGLDADDLNGNPLLFTIAAVVFLHDRQLSNNKASLYERFIQIWLEEATARGLKNELGDLYELVSNGLEELAFEMTDRPDENSSIILSRKLAIYLKDNLQVPLPKTLQQGKTLVDVLGTRSGMFVKTGRICDWAHGNFREYLAGRALDTRLFVSSDDYEKVLGERPLDSKWFEAVRTLVQVNSKSTEILKWIAGRAASKADAQSALLVHYYWTQSRTQNDPQTLAAVVDALLVGLADTQTGLNPPLRIKQALVGMGHPAVPALLVALSRLSNLQKELFPDWRGKKPPDVYTEPGKRLYQSSRQRQGIVEVFGQIKDPRTFDDLISLLDDDESDSNRIYLRQAAQKALACIGYPVIGPLLKVIGDSSHSTEKRHQALVALKLVGRRTDQVSQTLAECFREGLAGNHQLLNWSLFVATGLRDRNQSELAAETLKLNNQELVAEAADFFSVMHGVAPLKDLANSLERWYEMETHPFSGSFGFRSLLSALGQTRERFANQLVRSVIASSLRGEGQLKVDDALTEAGKLPIAGLRRLVLTTSLAQLSRPAPPAAGNRLIAFLRHLWASVVYIIVRKHRQRKEHRYNFRLSDAVRVLGNTWCVDQLAELVKATRRIEAVALTGVDDIISRYLHKPEAGSQSDFVDHGALAHAFAKCQVRHFAERIGRFLEAADWDFERELSDLLWIAGDPKAEGVLVSKLTKIRFEHSESNDRIPELYHVMRALGMCGSAQGVDKIIETVLETPNINIEFCQEVLWPLLKRRVLDPQRLITLADNSSTHEYARYFFVMGLGYFDAPTFSDFFVRMVADEDERVRANAAQFLGWSKEPKTVAVLIDLLRNTQSSFIAECAAGSLRRLGTSEASDEIIKAIERFGPAQRGGLIREAALLRNPSVVKYLKDITRKNEGSPWKGEDLLHAVGEFYDQPWAQTILEEWLEKTGSRYDTGQQRLAFGVLAERDPNKLLAQAVRLYDENGLEDSAQSRLVVLLRQLCRSQNVSSALLVPLLKRLLCDEELATRESVAEELIYLELAQRLQVYEELSRMGNEWAQACGVYSLAFWDSDESEIERMQYSPVHMVRYFADRALTIRRKRPHLRQLADSFAKTEGAARVSSYLVLTQEGSEQFLHYLDERIENDSLTSVFLPHMQTLVHSTAKKHQDTLMKEEENLFCQSARQVQFH